MNWRENALECIGWCWLANFLEDSQTTPDDHGLTNNFGKAYVSVQPNVPLVSQPLTTIDQGEANSSTSWNTSGRGLLYPAPCGSESLPPGSVSLMGHLRGPNTGTTLSFSFFVFSYLLSLHIFQIRNIF
jgi:hypothetical protein